MTDKLSQIRADLPAVQHKAFLNSGWYGPLPRPALEAIEQDARDQLETGRPVMRRIERVREASAGLRQDFAALFNVPLESVALTHHTTDGMNIVTQGFNWQPGDEVATTTIEHEAGIYPLYVLNHRYGVKINFADVGLGADPLPAIEAALTPRTRLLVLSHVSYSSGARLPLEEILTLAHDRGIPVLVDGAQSAGVFALDLTALNVDFYAIPGQKWLCGPEGVGMLYVRPDHIATLHPTYTNFFTVASHDWHGEYQLNSTAVKFETGTIYPGVLTGMRASLRWFNETVGPDWAYSRIAHIAAYTRARIAALDGVRIITPEHRQASLVNFLPVGWSAAQMAGLAAELDRRGYVIRSISHEPFAVRVSCGFFNTEAEIDGLVAELADVLRAGPDSVTIPDWAVQFNVPSHPVY
ncbi:MAG: aminotransferase class V-fold PLP-dependent enzyme [Anaerolineae bacterium]